MRLMPALALVLAPLPVAAGAATRNYTVTGYERIRVQAPFPVTLTVGPPGAARAEGALADLDRVRIEVQSRTLIVSVDRSGGPGERMGPVRIVASTPALTAAQVSGAGSLAIDRAKADRFDIASGGAGSLTLGRLEAGAVNVVVLGAGNVTIAGRAARARVAVQGAGDVDAKGLTAQDADVSVSGAGDVALVATRTAKVVSAGIGQVRITGGAACTVQRSGMGEVDCD